MRKITLSTIGLLMVVSLPAQAELDNSYILNNILGAVMGSTVNQRAYTDYRQGYADRYYNGGYNDYPRYEGYNQSYYSGPPNYYGNNAYIGNNDYYQRPNCRKRHHRWHNDYDHPHRYGQYRRMYGQHSYYGHGDYD